MTDDLGDLMPTIIDEEDARFSEHRWYHDGNEVLRVLIDAGLDEELRGRVIAAIANTIN